MNFGEALEVLKKGYKVSRTGWNGIGMWVSYNPTEANRLQHLELNYPMGSKPYPEGAKIPWVPSQTDMFAEDWVIIS